MTLDQILQSIHRIYESNTGYPSNGEEDYALRTGYVNDAIRIWGETEEVNWNSLYTDLASAGDGDSTTTASDSTYNTPTNFIKFSSLVKIGGVYYTYRKLDEVQVEVKNNSNSRIYYLTGSPGSYVLNINPTPDETGLTIEYNYYKTPTLMSDGTDVPDMTKPMYCVYYTLSRLYEADSRNDLMQFYDQKAQDVYQQMLIANEVPPFNHPYEIYDIDHATNGVKFGS